MRPALLAALAIHLLAAASYLWVTPVFEGPDESSHFEYVSHLLEQGSPPTILHTAELSGEPAHREAVLGHHGPLYYGLLALVHRGLGVEDVHPFLRIPSNRAQSEQQFAVRWLHGYDEVAPRSIEVRAFLAARALSVLCGALSLIFLHRLGRLVFPGLPAVADTAVLLLAALPQWSFTHGVLDNGNLATSLCLLATWRLCVEVERGCARPGPSFLLGLVVGAALVTKIIALVLLPLCGLAWLGVWVRERERRRRILGTALAASVGLLLTSGWFFARNQALYGSPLAMDAHGDAFAENLLPAELRGAYFRGEFWRLTLRSLVGSFGWGNVGAPSAVAYGFAGLGALGLLGWCVAGRRLVARPGLVLLMLASTALIWLALVRFNWTSYQPQGRYLFPGLGPMLLLGSAGLVGGFQRLFPRQGARSWVGVSALGLSLVALGTAWLHVRPALAFAPDPALPFHANLVRDLRTPAPPERARIEALEPADGAELSSVPTLRWRPASDPPTGAPFSVHLYSEDGRLLAASWEMVRFELQGPEFTMPDFLWEALPQGVPVHWKVRRLPDRSRGEEVREVEESAPRSFVRR